MPHPAAAGLTLPGYQPYQACWVCLIQLPLLLLNTSDDTVTLSLSLARTLALAPTLTLNPNPSPNPNPNRSPNPNPNQASLEAMRLSVTDVLHRKPQVTTYYLPP